MELLASQSPSPDQPPGGFAGFRKGVWKSGSVLQRIGWRRPSPEERRLWVIQGALILGAVLLIGTLMLLALR
ncbi:MAG: hypothetical protein HYY26_03230 [Acidobacteria bacterium]|nr:hypothetical protein [Acidobacteriota bacterium]